MAAGNGLRGALREVAQSASSVARLQAELTRSDLKTSSVLGLGAAMFAFMGFLLLTTLFVIALAIPLPAWLAILIVMVVYLAVAAVLGIRYRQTRGGSIAREQAQLTAAVFRGIRGSDDVPSVPAAPEPPLPKPAPEGFHDSRS